MVSLTKGKFNCVLLSPGKKLIDCRAGSVILPGHNGMLGIMRNHAPMLFKLTRGIVQIKDIADRKDAFYLVEDGFGRISENYLTILANEIFTFEGMETDEAERSAAKSKEIIAGGAYIKKQIGEVDID